MRTYLKILLPLLIPALGTAQRHYADSLRAALRNATNDSVRYSLNMQIGYYFQESERDSALHYYNAALLVARKHDQKVAEAGALGITGYQLALLGRYARSLQCLQDGFSILDENKSGSDSWVFSPDDSKPKDTRTYTLSRLQLLYSVLMHATKNTGQEIFYLKESIKNGKLINDPYRTAIPEMNLGRVYLKLHKLDSALLAESEALKTLQLSADKKYVGTVLTQIGAVYLEKRDMPLAKKYLYDGLQWLIKTNNLADMDWAYFGLTNYYLAERDKDSSLVSAKKTLQVALTLPTGDKDFNLDDIYQNLSLAYRLGKQPDSVTKYQAKALVAKDSIYRSRIKDLADFQNLSFRQQMHLRDVEKEKLAYQSRVRIFSFAGAALAFLIIGFILWRNNKKQKHTNILLNEQKEEISAQRDQLENKNQELEIESALERVRTVAMGMRTPDDLLNICEALFNELEALEFSKLRNALIQTYFDGQNYLLDYDYSDFMKGHINRISYKGYPIVEKFIQDIQKSKDAFAEIVIIGEELEKWKKFRGANNETPDERLDQNSALYYYFYSVGDTSIGISTFSRVPDDKLEILKRFRNVFDLAYRRYVDIKKAEAQAREAQIELALEKVRAKAMAMHKTDDLFEVAELLYREVTDLGITSMAAGHCLVAEDKISVNRYGINPVDGRLTKTPIVYRLTESKVMSSILTSWEKHEAFYVIELDEKETLENQKWVAKAMLESLKKHDPNTSFTVKSFLAASPKKVVLYNFNFTDGYLFIVRDERLTSEQEDIALRFTKVFQMTYRRYLDLKQAEAQVRESQIEAALERVRSRSMGMQKSDELKEVIQVVYAQFVHLGIPVEHTGFIMDIRERDDMHIWLADKHEVPAEITIPYFDSPHWNSYVGAKAKGIDFFANYLDFETKNKFYRDLFELIPGVTDEARQYYLSCPALAGSTVLLDTVGLYIENFSGIPFTDEENAILMRFGKVFQQTYTRFLDLQKAEEQAREAQVELSLERVRASAMAMHKTDQLLDAAELLYRELTGLGINSMAVTYSIMAADEKSAAYYSINPVDGKINPIPLDLPHTETGVMRSILSSWKKQETFSKLVLDEKATLQHQTYIAGKIQAFFARHNFDYNFSVEEFLAVSPKKAVIYTFNFTQGYIFIIGSEHLTKLQEEMVIRFAKVFEMTYRRFLDLKQAEEQARESQIQLALERVRARTMAMQQSTELAETASLVSQQLNGLGLSFSRVGFYIWKKDAAVVEGWTSNGIFDELLPPLVLPYMEDDGHRGIYEAAQRNEHSFEQVLGGNELKRHYEWLLSQPSVLGTLKTTGDNAHVPMPIQYKYAGIFKQGYLLLMATEPQPDAGNLLERFALVFEQTYTRFLDLKQAEDQARESQIQLALERVRARTMAMQQSDELADISLELFKQIQSLGIAVWHCAFRIYNEGQNSLTEWSTNVGGVYPHYQIPNEGIFRTYHDAGMAGETLHVEVFGEGRCADHYAWLCTLPEVGERLLALKAQGVSFPTSQIDHVAFFKYGYLIFVTYEPAPQAHDVFRRFAKVFEQTYTRFLDLEQAEEQARESEIQLALERVRARTMAMQKSDEMSEVIQVIYEQLVHLGLDVASAGFIMDYKESHDLNVWVSRWGQPYSTLLHIPYFDHPIFHLYVDAKEKGLDFYTVILTREEKDTLYSHICDYIPGMTDERRASVLSLPGYADSHVLTKDVVLYIQNFTGIPYSNAENDILKRFGNAFQQTYTRFSDLKKAEEQARESQIQLALERVRARTMAMQKSGELAETVFILFQQFKELGENPDQATIGIVNEKEKVIEYWVTMYGSQDNKVYKFSIDEPNVTRKIYNAWKHGKKSLVIDLSGKELNDFATYRQSMGGAKLNKDEKRRIINVAFFSKGLINVQSTEERSEESVRLLERFAGVFDGTYTRFLDLKQAEAQANESQIQLALERVRARTSAMQKSDELHEVIQLVFDQLHQLNFKVDTANFMLNYQETNDFNLWIATAGARYATKIDVPYIKHPLFDLFKEAKAKTGLYTDSFSKEEKDSFFEHFFNYLPDISSERKTFVFDKPGFARSIAFIGNTALTLINYQGTPFTDAENDILMRFGQAFDQTYTRFKDLEQAEAQTREAQIQLGLERVRARAMAMQSSGELAEVVDIVFKELTKLDFGLTHCAIAIADAGSVGLTLWQANSEADQPPVSFYRKSFDHPYPNAAYKEWKKRTPKWVYHLKGAEKKAMHDYYERSKETMHVPNAVKAGMASFDSIILSHSFNNFGYLRTDTVNPLSEENLDIIYRFAKVFDLCYTRFTDIKQAEAQARESQIQLALERVRARTMAMQHSEELAETAGVLFQQLHSLDIVPERVFVGIPIEGTRKIDFWGTQQGGTEMNTRFEADADAIYSLREVYKAWQAKESEAAVFLKGKNLEEHLHYMADILHMTLNRELVREQRILYCTYFSKGFLTIVTPELQSEETLNILQRFAAVFDQTYTRFLDLEKAEKAAREAQIEAALERVRSKTMAMHNSADVGETVTLMFNELVKLGVEKIARCGIAIPDNNKVMELWTARLNQGEKEDITIGYIDMTIHPMLELVYDAWKSKQATFGYILEGDDMADYITAINNSSRYPIKYDPGAWGEKQYHNDFFFQEGMVFAFTFQPLSAEIAAVFKRFAGVFGQTYRRYLDLQKAEAQAREAQIEAALERVRSKAMAMRSSADLNETANIVFVELRKLGVDLVRCGVGLMDKDSHITTIHAATNSAEGGSLEVLGKILMDIHPVFVGIYKHWERNEDYFPVLEEESLKTYYEKLAESSISVPEWKSGEKQYGYFFPFADGSLYAWSSEQESEATIKTLKRFTSVIGLTYTRYIELQKAELNTKEAIKQASLDRVRAEIASMRKRSDLERITPLIWEELTVLGIPFIRCGVFIMDDEQRLIHTFLSTPDGKAIGAFHVPFDTSGNFEKMVDSWRHKVPYIDHWKEEAFSQFADTLVRQGAIASKAQYMKTLPHEGVHLNFLPFLQGMLYVGNGAPIPEENIDLVQSVAEAFSTAYARYEDFNKLEAAKQQVDNTLTQLKTTQTKLIQSEKMASLGELTAGIAHEIQNPLNFVNNFSEVSAELIDEMDEELDKGDIEEAKAIAVDIRENLQKIRHHGGRADGIVKGMLQHSRASSGQKDPTDLNGLADEYLRLAYHGLRAKDKSFNIEMVTHFDVKLPKAAVVPQDVGRVLINLYNNAFYATQEKAKTTNGEYKPEVVVTTFAEDGQAIIKVKDNGNGIPDAIKDKIMQPFFTTKPTGEGTGLGLSLSYDIVVKGHGGKIDVETKENEFTEFTVSLPIN